MAWLTTSDLKALLGVSATTWDTQIAALIPVVQSGIESEIGRAIEDASYSEQHSGRGATEVVLRHRPIISVSGVWDSLDRVFDDSTKISSDRYHVWKESGRIELIRRNVDWPDESPRNTRFGDGVGNVRVDYTAGYATDPGELKLVLAHDVWTVINTGKSGGKSSESIGDHSVTYQTAFDRRLPQMQAIVDAWKRRGVIR